MTTITTRPGNPEAIVPYGYLVITDEVGESEEPISDRAMTAIEEHFAMLTDLISHALRTDGGHHKQWFLEQIAEESGIALPMYEKRGIAP